MKRSVVIPAAGLSIRMGMPKAHLPYSHGFSFAEHLVDFFGMYGCIPVVLVVNEHFESTLFHSENLVTVVNHHPDKGRIWSVHLGLKEVPAGFDCFLQNVDNPFTEPVLLDKLVDSLAPEGYAVPVYRGRGGHPILLGSKVVDFFRHREDEIDFRTELQRFTRVEVPFPDERIHWNINTLLDYKEFLQWKRHSHKKL